MGYFSNSTEGMDYEAQYCQRCVHDKPDDGGCAVWLAHLLKNYDECNNEDSILHLLIPRTQDGLGNEQCLMFLRKAQGVVRTAAFEVQDDWIDDGTETKKPADRQLPDACKVCGARWVCEHQR